MRLQPSSQSFNWKRIQTKLIIDNCLTFGHDQNLTPQKISRYLLGTRIKIELFKLYELRCLLLKVYPLIHNLFYNPRLNCELETKKVLPTSSKIKNNQKGHSNAKIQQKLYPTLRSSLISKDQHFTPQILFATITPAFGNIIQGAAEICNMPVHKNRWLNGSITAAISYLFDQDKWNYLADFTQNDIFQKVTQIWGTNKEDKERIREKLTYYGSSRWPSLLVIPDIANNEMIIREAKAVNLPIIGLVNSHCQFEIDYPIFAQDQTQQSIYFFCYFLAGLIAKETVYSQHKRFTIQKIKRCASETIWKRSLKLVTTKQIVSKDDNKTFFFQKVKPFQEKNEMRPFFWKSFPNFFAQLQSRLKILTNLPSYKELYRKAASRKTFPRKKKIYRKVSDKIVGKKVSHPKFGNRFNKNWRPNQNRHLNHNRHLQQLLQIVQYYTQHTKTPIKLDEKYLILLQHWTRSIRAVVIMHMENTKKFANVQRKNSWTLEEQKETWQNLKTFLVIENLTRLQKVQDQSIFEWDLSTTNNSYYWLTLQQWNQDTQWQNHKFILQNFLQSSFKHKQAMSILKSKTYYKKKLTPNWKKQPWQSWKTKSSNKWLR